jgi:hypothetical protein
MNRSSVDLKRSKMKNSSKLLFSVVVNLIYVTILLIIENRFNNRIMDTSMGLLLMDIIYIGGFISLIPSVFFAIKYIKGKRRKTPEKSL